MLTLSKEGIPIAKIFSGKCNNKVVTASDKTEGGKRFRFLGLAADAKFQLAPNPKTERQTSTPREPVAAARAPLPERI